MGTAAVNGGVSSETRTTKNNALCDIQLGPDSTNNVFKGAGILTANTISSRTHKSLAVIFPSLRAPQFMSRTQTYNNSRNSSTFVTSIQ